MYPFSGAPFHGPGGSRVCSMSVPSEMAMRPSLHHSFPLCLSLILALAPISAAAQAEAFTFEVIDLPRGGEDDPRPPIPVAVWTPSPPEADEEGESDGAGERLPLFLFSHGYGGSGGSYTYLTERIAAAGWIVVAPDHSDAVSVMRLREDDEIGNVLQLIRTVKALVTEEFDFEEHRYRIDEATAVLDGILAHERFGARIDPTRIAVGGHSFGGYTTLGMAGAIPGRADPRVDGVVLLSPGLFMYEADDFARVEVPTLYMLGENELADERGPWTKLDLSRVAYDSFPKPKHLLVLEDGRHLSFNDRSRTALSRRKRQADADLDAIARVVLAFLEESARGQRDTGADDTAAVARETGRFLDFAPREE